MAKEARSCFTPTPRMARSRPSSWAPRSGSPGSPWRIGPRTPGTADEGRRTDGEERTWRGDPEARGEGGEPGAQGRARGSEGRRGGRRGHEAAVGRQRGGQESRGRAGEEDARSAAVAVHDGARAGKSQAR